MAGACSRARGRAPDGGAGAAIGAEMRRDAGAPARRGAPGTVAREVYKGMAEQRSGESGERVAGPRAVIAPKGNESP